jgi:hypothetical protein
MSITEGSTLDSLDNWSILFETSVPHMKKMLAAIKEQNYHDTTLSYSNSISTILL